MTKLREESVKKGEGRECQSKREKREVILRARERSSSRKLKRKLKTKLKHFFMPIIFLFCLDTNLH